nr:cyclase family protein [Pseudomonas sp. HN11]
MVGKPSKVVSLSHPISPRIPLWPGDPLVEFEDVASLAEDGNFLRRFSMGEHSATHMNAPNSFYAGGMGIEGYQPEDLVRPAVVIDVRARCNPDYEISGQDIEDWERQHGLIEPGSMVLMYTGWQHLCMIRQRSLDRTRKARTFLELARRRFSSCLNSVKLQEWGLIPTGLIGGRAVLSRQTMRCWRGIGLCWSA